MTTAELRLEREASMRRQAKREAKHLADCRRVNRLYGERVRERMKGRSDFYGRMKASKYEDFLPPDDLCTSHRRVR